VLIFIVGIIFALNLVENQRLMVIFCRVPC